MPIVSSDQVQSPFTNRLLLAVALFGGFFLRLFTVFCSTSIELDGISYATMADQITQGHFGAVLKNVFPPVYPTFVALIHLIVTDVELAGRLTSVLFGMLLIGLVYGFAKRISGSKEKATWAALLIALHPDLIRYSGQVLSESVATFVFAAAVYSFYVGWQEDRRFPAGLAGFWLCLAYLTRPEYIVFYAPFVLLLLGKKRFLDIAALLAPVLVLGTLYVLRLHSQTGLWIISNKATLSPIVPGKTFLANVPLVSYEFLAALSPVLLVLVLLGIRGASKPYGSLAALLLLFHILSLAFVSHATKRYSVEFVPICAVIAVGGIQQVRQYLGRVLSFRIVTAVVAGVIILVGCFQSYASPRRDRALHKEAGLFLKTLDPGSIVAGRLPLVAFYGKAAAVDLVSLVPKDASVSGFVAIMSEKGIRYVVLDNTTEEVLPVSKEAASQFVFLKEFRYKNDFVGIYDVAEK